MHYRNLLQTLREGDKKVVVAGLGISGIEAALTLDSLGLSVLCTESYSEEEYLKRGKYREEFSRLQERSMPIVFGCSSADIDFLVDSAGLLVLSPGIPFDGEFAQAFRDAGVEITNELELAADLYNLFSIFITGTNGKSTTTTLIASLLEAAGRRPLLCGNVGRPVIADLPTEILDADYDPQKGQFDILVVEISSYQIESASRIVPDIGVFLNLSQNHLERHGTLENYFDIKSSLFERQGTDQWLIYNRDDEMVRELPQKIDAKCISFGCEQPEKERLSARVIYSPESGIDRIEFRQSEDEPGEESCIYDLSNSNLIGEHNRLNMAAALLVTKVLKISPEGVIDTARNFCGLEHRMERVPVDCEAVVFNDSKATTPLATEVAIQAALDAYLDRRLILCVGGKLKRGGDLPKEWSPVVECLISRSQQIERVFCFGGDGGDVHEILNSRGIVSEVADGVQSLVQSISEHSSEPITILFSPGCASFDEFTDFEKRGSVFKSKVVEHFGSSC